MARSTKEIKEEITEYFMSSPDTGKAYGFTTGTTFTSFFSKASVENLLFYAVAYCMSHLERLWDDYSAEIDTRILERLPHTGAWYCRKALAYMYAKELPEGEDTYDTKGMSEDEITAARIVKHAAYEEPVSGGLVIKVAGETGGSLAPITTAGFDTMFSRYINLVKDAGVRITVVNKRPDTLKYNVTILYDRLKSETDVKESCRAAIESYLSSLPFNGEYSNQTLTDVLQAIAGVKIATLNSAIATDAEGLIVDNLTRYTATAGYMTAAADSVITMTVYE